MESGRSTPELVVVVGVTASGKSELAMKIAEEADGEIIAADSRTVYQGMDIGTAKPSKADQARVPHHLIDVTKPDQPFTAADFKRLAEKAITDISERGKLPILVGGSGLYVDAVLYDFVFRPHPKDKAKRQAFDSMSIEELQAKLREKGIALPENSRNRRHLIRSLETGGEISKRNSLRPNTLIIGLSIPKSKLNERIKKRVDQMVVAGLAEEVKELMRKYGQDNELLKTPGYKAFQQYITGRISLEQAKKDFVRGDLQLAKKQRTWFRRNSSIQWYSSEDDAFKAVLKALNT